MPKEVSVRKAFKIFLLDSLCYIRKEREPRDMLCGGGAIYVYFHLEVRFRKEQFCLVILTKLGKYL